MSRKYTVQLVTHQQPTTVVAEDVQIKPDSIKFLDGKGAQAVLVAYFNPTTVLSILEVKA